jgi:hypothetical protein
MDYFLYHKSYLIFELDVWIIVKWKVKIKYLSLPLIILNSLLQNENKIQLSFFFVFDRVSSAV